MNYFLNQVENMLFNSYLNQLKKAGLTNDDIELLFTLKSLSGRDEENQKGMWDKKFGCVKMELITTKCVLCGKIHFVPLTETNVKNKDKCICDICRDMLDIRTE